MSGADIDWHCVLKTSVFDLMSVSKVQPYRGSEEDWLVLRVLVLIIQLLFSS